MEQNKMQFVSPDKNGYIAIENVYPQLDDGKFPVKRTIDDIFEVWADIYKTEHGQICAQVKYRNRLEKIWTYQPMTFYDNDRWIGSFQLSKNTVYEYSIEAWSDTFTTLINNMKKWLDAGEDIKTDMADVYTIISDSLGKIKRNTLEYKKLSSLRQGIKKKMYDDNSLLRLLSSDDIVKIIHKYQNKSDLTESPIFTVIVDRSTASFGSWYEMFHRSQGTIANKGATFKDCEKRLGEIKELGFDVVYLPPIHPVGKTNRRGRNNSSIAGPKDPGSPWAIGNEHGGHKSVNPELGSIEDFTELVKKTKQLGMEIAIDLAFNCSPDHPYVKEHPEWFLHRQDGSIRYAENPPKRYYDIYPIYFANHNWKDLWNELLDVFLFWIKKGIRIFRVDNPHTKPSAFWEWVIKNIRNDYHDVIFLSEAFTRPKPMKYLAKIGFTQSYTYFTWKNTKQELEEFISEFLISNVIEYYRGNLFPSTPDILPIYLQKGGIPAFKIRLILAATISPVYGIYNGYELCENLANPGTEEYLDSEKYQYKIWDWDRPENIKPLIKSINQIRKENPSLQSIGNLHLLRADNQNIIFYGKWNKNKSNIILVTVNLDPFETHDSLVYVPIRQFGIDYGQKYFVNDLLTGNTYEWVNETNYVKLSPEMPAHILLLEKQ